MPTRPWTYPQSHKSKMTGWCSHWLTSSLTKIRCAQWARLQSLRSCGKVHSKDVTALECGLPRSGKNTYKSTTPAGTMTSTDAFMNLTECQYSRRKSTICISAGNVEVNLLLKLSDQIWTIAAPAVMRHAVQKPQLKTRSATLPILPKQNAQSLESNLLIKPTQTPRSQKRRAPRVRLGPRSNLTTTRLFSIPRKPTHSLLWELNLSINHAWNQKKCRCHLGKLSMHLNTYLQVAQMIRIPDLQMTQDTRKQALKLMSTTFKTIVEPGTQWNTWGNSTVRLKRIKERDSHYMLGLDQPSNGTWHVSRIRKSRVRPSCGLSPIHSPCQQESKLPLFSLTLSSQSSLSACAALVASQRKREIAELSPWRALLQPSVDVCSWLTSYGCLQLLSVCKNPTSRHSRTTVWSMDVLINTHTFLLSQWLSRSMVAHKVSKLLPTSPTVS